MTEKNYLQAISDGLRQEMQHDERVYLIGEDIGVFGGAFKVTQGFQEEFGEWRVIDSPLSETAIVASCSVACSATPGIRSTLPWTLPRPSVLRASVVRAWW